MGLLYDVNYYAGDRRLPDFDIAVSERYVERIAASLLPDESAYAHCINGPAEYSREILPMKRAETMTRTFASGASND